MPSLYGTTLDDAADYVALLDKCGEDSPMQKRIISIVPIFMLSDISLRFSQLQQRQAKVMPPTLLGDSSKSPLTNLSLKQTPLVGPWK